MEKPHLGSLKWRLYACLCVSACIAIAAYVYMCVYISTYTTDVCMYVCMYMYVCIFLYVYVCMYMYVCIFLYVYVYVYIYMYMYVYVYVYAYVYVYVCVRICMYVYIYLCGVIVTVYDRLDLGLHASVQASCRPSARSGQTSMWAHYESRYGAVLLPTHIFLQKYVGTTRWPCRTTEAAPFSTFTRLWSSLLV